MSHEISDLVYEVTFTNSDFEEEIFTTAHADEAREMFNAMSAETDGAVILRSYNYETREENIIAEKRPAPMVVGEYVTKEGLWDFYRYESYKDAWDHIDLLRREYPNEYNVGYIRNMANPHDSQIEVRF